MDTYVRGYVIMDLETTNLFVDGVVPDILCGCTRRLVGPDLATAEVDESLAWHTDKLDDPDAFAPLSKIIEMVNYLADNDENGFLMTGWNSIGFDSRVIYETLALYPEDPDAQHAIARFEKVVSRQVDPMFCFYVYKGYPVGLQATANGFGVGGKTMDGKQAVKMWKAGDPADRQKVIDYCHNDCIVTHSVMSCMHQQNIFKWISKRMEDVSYRPNPIGNLTLPFNYIIAVNPISSMNEKRKIPKCNFVGWIQRAYPDIDLHLD